MHCNSEKDVSKGERRGNFSFGEEETNQGNEKYGRLTKILFFFGGEQY